jgi:hypothetical protein
MLWKEPQDPGEAAKPRLQPRVRTASCLPHIHDWKSNVARLFQRLAKSKEQMLQKEPQDPDEAAKPRLQPRVSTASCLPHIKTLHNPEKNVTKVNTTLRVGRKVQTKLLDLACSRKSGT